MIAQPSSKIRVGIQLAPQHVDYPVIRRAAAQAEELGVDVLFNWDHFFPLGKVADGKHFECWTMLGAWAEATSRVEIGPLVTCNSYRNPDLLADMARTVDHISGGRLILGLGAGFKEREYVEYGYEFGTPGSRIDDLARSLPRIEHRFTQLDPPPTRKIPLLIGGGGEKKMLRVVAQHADIWHSFAGGDELAHKLKVLEEHCAAVGRDPAEIQRSVLVGGDPAECERELELGVSLFVVRNPGPDFDFGELRDWLAWRDEHNRDDHDRDVPVSQLP
ncbi:putative F420-dependent oxidoreductase [Catenulispora sp. EB89]|uniref:LLM class F420-dependent oxidoreductase n=1 Tax=Catenulispora sp. EB89 TaxID=3156257 RepID=UPI003516AA34